MASFTTSLITSHSSPPRFPHKTPTHPVPLIRIQSPDARASSQRLGQPSAISVVKEHVAGHGELPGGGRGGRGDPATAADVMRRNPGHYVALVVLHHVSGGVDPDPAVAGEGGGTRITKIKLLKPKDTLLLGQVYRLITSQEVTKAVQTRKQERMRGCDEAIEQQRPRLHRRRQPPRPRGDNAATTANGEQRHPADHQERKWLETDRQHRSIARGRGRGRHWRPALQSITESSWSGHTDCKDTCK